jgi:hypothetical protein
VPVKASSSSDKPYTDAWLAEAEKNIAASEYNPLLITKDENNKDLLSSEWILTNRANNFSATLNTKGWQMQFGQKGDNDFTWNFNLQGINREDGHQISFGSLNSSQITNDNNKIIFQRDKNTQEWYKNSDQGLEQGFTINTKPAGTGKLTLFGNLKTNLQASSTSDKIDFDSNGKKVFQYGNLTVTDSLGKKIPAKISYADKQIKLIIDDSQAVYPITVDPLASSPSWSASGAIISSDYGFSIATGDIKHNGYVDVAIGAPGYANNRGAVFVYYTTAAGLGVAQSWTYNNNQDGSRFGSSVAMSGDVNNDGYADLIVSAPDYLINGKHSGAVFAYYGSSSGLASCNWTVYGGQDGENFGASLALAGDTNHDTYGDVIVGAPGYNNGSANNGAAFVYNGSATGLATSTAWSALGNQANEDFGISVAGAGIIRHSSSTSVIIGADGAGIGGSAFVYYGSDSGLSATPDWTATSDEAGAKFGSSVATAGDVNGDGYKDIIIGANNYSHGGLTANGAAYVYQGSASGLVVSPNWSAYGSQSNEGFGYSVSTAGAITHSSSSAVIIGAKSYNNGTAGAVFAYYGTPSGLNAMADWSQIFNQASADKPVVASGDFNGDGYSDVIVGFSDYLNADNYTGVAFSYNGSVSGLSNTANWTKEDNEIMWMRFGCSVASAGDVNGDGYGDVVIGASAYNYFTSAGAVFVYYGSASGLPSFPSWAAYGTQLTIDSSNQGEHLGQSVATAGDVNGDGYSDIIVGAPQYVDSIRGEVGAAFVYHGSASGLSSVPNWTVVGEQTGGIYNDELFGFFVATAGDVNGDGYDDVLVSSPAYDSVIGGSHSGRTSLYYGSVSGLPTTPNLVIDGETSGAFAGWSLSTAGDVNGDGYSDIITDGSPVHHEGTAEVYYGSASGIVTSTHWYYPLNLNLPGLPSVSAAGDVNGDGYDDVIVGFPHNYYDNDGPGTVTVFYGSKNGIASTTPNWTVSGTISGEAYGGFVSSAGDVNSDGYADVLITNGTNVWDNPSINYGTSAKLKGLVDVYNGGPNGLSASPNWSVTDDKDPFYTRVEQTGNSAGTAGDIKGNNLNDLIVGAPQESTVWPIMSGAAFVYYGSTSTDMSLIPKQLNSNGNQITTGARIATSTYQINLTGRLPMGRTRARIVYELKETGTNFNGTNLVYGNWFDTGLKGTSSSVTITGLQANKNYHWRAREQYLPYMNFSPWYSPSGTNISNASEIHLSVIPYNLNYFAGTHGSLVGSVSQTAFQGSSGSGVTAVGDSGYHFVQWSDGSTANPRVDSHVPGDISVTATFSLPTSSGSGGGSSFHFSAPVVKPSVPVVISPTIIPPTIISPAPASGASIPTVSATSSLKYIFKRNLATGSIGADVMMLQKYLNANGFILVKSGPGSSGQETSKFGAATRTALIKFQKANNISPAIGYFGPATRKV